MAKDDTDDLPDFNDDDLDSGSPPFPVGDYEIDVLTTIKYDSTNDQIQGDALMFRLEAKVVEVIREAPADHAHANDKPRQVYGVQVGQTRQWQCQIGPKDKKGKLSYKCGKNAARVKELMQALLRFEPGSKLASEVGEKQADGSIKGPWNEFFALAVGEQNVFQGKPCRISMSRQTFKGDNAMYIPQFTVSSRVKTRETTDIDDF